MCNRARNKPPALRPMDNRFNPVEFHPKVRARVIREVERRRRAEAEKVLARVDA